MHTRRKVALALSTVMLGPLFTAAVTIAPAEAAGPSWTKNCTQLHKKYPHGVGKKNAKDKTSSKKKVTNFKKSNSLFKKAMSHNKGLDRDKDKIACEKA